MKHIKQILERLIVSLVVGILLSLFLLILSPSTIWLSFVGGFFFAVGAFAGMCLNDIDNTL